MFINDQTKYKFNIHDKLDANRQDIQSFMSLFSEPAKKTGTKVTTLRSKITPAVTRFMPLTSVRISPKKDILTWSSKGPCARNPNLERLYRTLTAIAYAEFENVIEIDRNRNVIYDFGS